MLDEARARAFAHRWIDAWNAHDMERILCHYSDDFEVSSPHIAQRSIDADAARAARS